MARLNLICHGMMLFHELDDDHIMIVIPPIEPYHNRAYGTPDHCRRDEVTDFGENAPYMLIGPVSSGAPLRDLVDSKRHLVTRQDRISFNRASAEKNTVTVTVPKPTQILGFRAIDLAIDIFGGTPSDVAFAVPETLNDVIVLSYLNQRAGTLTLAGAKVLLKKNCKPGIDVTNWCLYAQEIAPAGSSTRHPTVLNDYLNLAGGLQAGKSTQFVLSDIGKKEVASDTSAEVGITKCHLADLPTLVGGGLVTTTSPTGCTGLFHAKT